MMILRISLLLSFGALTGCFSVDPSRMGAIDIEGLSSHPQVVALEARSRIDQSAGLEGGEAFVTDLAPSAEDLDASVRKAIDTSGFLAGIDENAEWTLRVVLRRAALVEGTGAEWGREAKVICNWSLIAAGVEDPLWSDRISTNARGNSVMGDRRTADAVEGAVRLNIRGAFLALQESGVLSGGSQ